MKLINMDRNTCFHMIPLWKSPIKLPMEATRGATRGATREATHHDSSLRDSAVEPMASNPIGVLSEGVMTIPFLYCSLENCRKNIILLIFMMF